MSVTVCYAMILFVSFTPYTNMYTTAQDNKHNSILCWPDFHLAVFWFCFFLSFSSIRFVSYLLFSTFISILSHLHFVHLENAIFLLFGMHFTRVQSNENISMMWNFIENRSFWFKILLSSNQFPFIREPIANYNLPHRQQNVNGINIGWQTHGR